MPRKKNIEESRNLVDDARARVRAEKEAARELAQAEAVVAADDARQRVEDRKALLDGLLAQYQKAVADHEKVRAEAVAAALEYVPHVRAAEQARNRIEAAYAALKPQINLNDPAEQESTYNQISHAPDPGVNQHGAARDIFRKKLGLSREEFDALTAVLNFHLL